MILEEKFEHEHAKIEEITENLVEKGFLKRIEGMIPRYIPLEPYFSFFTKNHDKSKKDVSKIRDFVLPLKILLKKFFFRGDF